MLQAIFKLYDTSYICIYFYNNYIFIHYQASGGGQR